jgi:hypothetical protein
LRLVQRPNVEIGVVLKRQVDHIRHWILRACASAAASFACCADDCVASSPAPKHKAIDITVFKFTNSINPIGLRLGYCSKCAWFSWVTLWRHVANQAPKSDVTKVPQNASGTISLIVSTYFDETLFDLAREVRLRTIAIVTIMVSGEVGRLRGLYGQVA